MNYTTYGNAKFLLIGDYEILVDFGCFGRTFRAKEWFRIPEIERNVWYFGNIVVRNSGRELVNILDVRDWSETATETLAIA